METIYSQIRDILYFDFEKASSIWSQFQWGQIKEFSVDSEDTSTNNAGLEIGIPNLVKAKLNLQEGEKRRILETRILHHDLLNRIISLLTTSDLIINLNDSISSVESSPEKIREVIQNHPYIIAEGWSVFEDYQKILLISEKFNELAKFIGMCAIENYKKGSDYLIIKDQLIEAKTSLKKLKDPKEIAKQKSIINELENSINKNLDNNKGVEEWILNGIRLLIKTYMPTRINFRVYPFTECPTFQILCNLKRESFVDQDFDHLLYGYGNQPNIPLTIFGLITSIPEKNGIVFDPMSEFKNCENVTGEANIEEAFRNLFIAINSLENFTRYSRYPNITIHPIAVFRSFPNLIKNT